MITLKTGVPGSGKTLSAVHELVQAVKRESDRAVFVHGVKALAVNHRKLPVTCVQGGHKVEKREVIDVVSGERDVLPVLVEDEDPGSIYTVDWSQVPDGSLVIVDEAQRVFPMRGAGQKVPPHVAYLNTHRHRGIDIWVITQHPKLIDNAVRRLVGKHQHYRRVFGGARAVVYEWDSCSDGLQFSSATKGLWNYPKKSYSYYRSAEVHTKQKHAWPLWLVIPALAIPAGILLAPKAFAVMHGAATGKGIPSSQSSASSPAPGGAVSRGQGAPLQVATSASAAYGPVMSIGVPVRGCWAQAERCECIGDAGRRLRVDLATCRISAAGFDGLVQWEPQRGVPYHDSRAPSPQAAASAAGVPALL